MAATEAFSGSEMVGTTEHSFTTDTAGPDVETTDGVFQCFLDLSAMVVGDAFDFRIYEKVLSSSSQRCVLGVPFLNAQGADNAVWVSPPFILMHGWDMTLKKTAGTDRNIDWSIRKA